jgi:hypothetical protein
LSGDTLLVEMLSRIKDERERVLILAHIGLDISLRNLARTLETSCDEFAEQANAVITRLREDAELAAKLNGIRRAGRTEHYLALAVRLGLQDWFCSWCGDFLVQPERGRKRKTCGRKCRDSLYRAHGIGWKVQNRPRPTKSSLYAPIPVLPALTANDWQKILELIQPVDLGNGGDWWHATGWRLPEVRCRDRALLLLGFTCRVPISSSDVTMLNVSDVIFVTEGLEVRLHPRATRAKTYVTVPRAPDSRLCKVVPSDLEELFAQLRSGAANVAGVDFQCRYRDASVGWTCGQRCRPASGRGVT